MKNTIELPACTVISLARISTFHATKEYIQIFTIACKIFPPDLRYQRRIFMILLLQLLAYDFGPSITQTNLIIIIFKTIMFIFVNFSHMLQFLILDKWLYFRWEAC